MMGTMFDQRIKYAPKPVVEPEPSIWPYAVKVVGGALIVGAVIGALVGNAKAGEYDNSPQMDRYEVCWSNFAVDGLDNGLSFDGATKQADQQCTATRKAAVKKDGKQWVAAMRQTFETQLCRANPDKCV